MRLVEAIRDHLLPTSSITSQLDPKIDVTVLTVVRGRVVLGLQSLTCPVNASSAWKTGIVLALLDAACSTALLTTLPPGVRLAPAGIQAIYHDSLRDRFDLDLFAAGQVETGDGSSRVTRAEVRSREGAILATAVLRSP